MHVSSRRAHCAAMLMVALGAGGCSDSPAIVAPTGSAIKGDSAAKLLAEGSSVVVSRTVVARALRPGHWIPSAVFADTGRYLASVARGSARLRGARLGDVGGNGMMRLRGAVSASLSAPAASGAERGAMAVASDEVVAVDDRVTRRSGRWRTKTSHNGRTADVEFAAYGGAPASDITVRVAGEVVLRVSRTWVRAGGVWALSRKSVFLFRNGQQLGSIETSYDFNASRLASERPVREADRRSRTPVRADVISPIYGDDETGVDDGGVCDAEVRAVKSALQDYLASTALLGVALLTGNPAAIAGALINELRAAARVDLAEEALDECVKTAGSPLGREE